MNRLKRVNQLSAVGMAVCLISLSNGIAWSETAPFMAMMVPPPAQVPGVDAQTESGLGVTYLGWESSRSTRRSGTTDIDNPFDERTVSWRHTALLDYNVYKDFTGLVAIPYVDNTDTFQKPAQPLVDQSFSGVGDVSVYGKYAFYKDQLFNARREAQAIVGLEFPTGSTHEKDATGAVLPATEQAGSGTTNVILGESLIWGLTNFSFYSDVTYKIYTHASYSFGNQLYARAGVDYPLPFYRRLSVTTELIGQFVARDKTDTPGAGVLSDGKVDSSGGETYFIAPGFQWNMWKAWTLSSAFQVPVYQNLRGTQLKTDLNVTFALSTRFGGTPHQDAK